MKAINYANKLNIWTKSQPTQHDTVDATNGTTLSIFVYLKTDQFLINYILLNSLLFILISMLPFQSAIIIWNYNSNY